MNANKKKKTTTTVKQKQAAVWLCSEAGRLGSGPPATPQVVDDRILTLTPLHITCPASAATQNIPFVISRQREEERNQSETGLAVAEAFKIKVPFFPFTGPDSQHSSSDPLKKKKPEG